LENDRNTSTTNLNGVYIKGGNTETSNADAYVSYLTLPADTYFSTTSFTITFWINVVTIPGKGKQARVIDFSDVPTKANGIAVWIKQGTNASNAAITIESTKTSTPLTVADGGAGFSAGWTHVAITVSTSGSPATITTAIYYNGEAITTYDPVATTITALPATTTKFTSNFIGKGTSPVGTDENLDAYLNDVKIFNSTLSATLVKSQYTSELCNFYFQISYFINLFNFNYFTSYKNVHLFIFINKSTILFIYCFICCFYFIFLTKNIYVSL